jgi:hypothetical protein
VADTVKLRHRDTGEVLERPKSAAQFFPDYDVLTADGRVNTKATAAIQPAPTKEK